MIPTCHLLQSWNYIYQGGFHINFLRTSRVTQDSALRPLLFILFINDMVGNIDGHYLLCADDMKLFDETMWSISVKNYKLSRLF